MQISEHEVWLPLRQMGSSEYSSLCCMYILGHVSWELKIQKGVLSHRMLKMVNVVFNYCLLNSHLQAHR